MGKPFQSRPDAGARSIVQVLMNEVVSAMSSLNMYPEPKAAPEGAPGYLSETDEWAAHCMEHLEGILQELNKLDTKVGKVTDIAYRHSQGRTTDEELFDQLMDLVNGKEEGDAEDPTH
jgi:hypothetical protein